MNWYKKSQTVLDDIDVVNGIDSQYLEIGHHEFGKKKSRKPNYMWVLVDGMVDIELEDKGFFLHGHSEIDRWKDINFERTYSGRYDSATGKISLVLPQRGISQFKDIPDFIIRKLKEKFPKSTAITVFAENENNIKVSQVINTEEDAKRIAPKYNLFYNGVMKGRDRSLFQFTTNNGNGTTFSLRPGEDIRTKIK